MELGVPVEFEAEQLQFSLLDCQIFLYSFVNHKEKVVLFCINYIKIKKYEILNMIVHFGFSSIQNKYAFRLFSLKHDIVKIICSDMIVF